jgi:hypothetical protein
MKIKYLSIFCIIPILFSCSSLNEKISYKNLSHLKKIAVISDLGSDLNYHYAGATALRNREQKVGVPWELDSFITQTISTQLKKNTHFELIEIKGAEFKTHPHFDQLITAKKSGADLRPYLDQLLQEGFDGLILVQAWRQVEDTTIHPGFGIFYDNRLLVHDQNFYLTAKMRVYSTHKKNELSSIDLLKNPYIELENFPKRKTFAEWPEADLTTLKSMVEQKLINEIPFRLIKLGLI